jgi:hypothetical protein
VRKRPAWERLSAPWLIALYVLLFFVPEFAEYSFSLYFGSKYTTQTGLWGVVAYAIEDQCAVSIGLQRHCGQSVD